MKAIVNPDDGSVTLTMTAAERAAQLRHLASLAAQAPYIFHGAPLILRTALAVPGFGWPADAAPKPDETAARLAGAVTAYLEDVADRIDHLLDDENADRQYLLESLLTEFRDVIAKGTEAEPIPAIYGRLAAVRDYQ